MKNSSKSIRNVLVILLVFLGVGAIGGGAVLILSPSGELMGMPLSMLDHSPFSSFLIPGIVLFTILGIFPIVNAITLVKKPDSILAERLNAFKDMHWSWSYTIYTAFALIIWIQLELIFLNAVHWLHTFYMFLALTILSIALLKPVRDLYKR
jgi:hypothetical protein